MKRFFMFLLIPLFLLFLRPHSPEVEEALQPPAVAAIKREMQQLVEGEKGDAPAPEDRTDVKPVNKAQARQDSLSVSGNQPPKALLPP